MSRLALLLLALAALPRPAWAWDAETHYAWTYYVALHTGYTERQAHQVASATQAVSDDPDTAVQPADWRDPGAGLDEASRATLGELHCFAEEPESPPRNAVEALGFVSSLDVPPSGEARLWSIAVETGNPGPLVHYVQDCVAHRGFSDRIGHAAAGHFPDWIATDIEASRKMTFHTARVLVKYQQEVLGAKPPPVDRGRLFTVLDQIAEESMVDQTGIIGEDGPLDPVVFIVDALRDVPPAEAIARRKTLQPKLEETFDTGRPPVDAAIRVLAAAIGEDKVLDRLPKFEVEGWEPPPLSWLPYDLDSHARPVEGTEQPWALEQVGVSMPGQAATARVRLPEADAADRLVAIEVRRPYAIEGALRLPPAGGVPVHTTCKVGEDRVEWTTARSQGEHAVQTTLYRPAADLAEGLRWVCTAHAHGAASVTSVVEVPPVPASQVAADTPDLGEPGPLQPQVDAMVAQRDEALGLAGDVATACGIAAEVRRSAEADVAAMKARIEATRRALASTREATEAVPGWQPQSDGALEAARAFHADTVAARERMDKGVRAACSGGGATALARVEAERAATETLAASLAERVEAIAGWRDGAAALQREGRRLQDAVWALDPALTFLERSVGSARSTVREHAEQAERLQALSAEATAALPEAEATFKSAGKPRKAKATLDALAVLAEQVQAAAAHRACVQAEQDALQAVGDQVVDLVAEAGEVSSDRALLDKRLPSAELLFSLTADYVAARSLQADLADLRGELIMGSDRAARCAAGR